MDMGILSIKLMILGGVLFLAGWQFALDGSLAATLAFLAGPVVVLIGLLMGNRRKAREEK